jgi:DNA-binding PadR family transcriptional regulator
MTAPYRAGYVPGPERRILLVLLTGAEELSGFPACRAAQSGPGVFYPLTRRLESAGWVISEWEPNPKPDQAGRRRYYQLTINGQQQVRALLGLTAPGVTISRVTEATPYRMQRMDRRVLLALATGSLNLTFGMLAGIAPGWSDATRALRTTVALNRLRDYGWITGGKPVYGLAAPRQQVMDLLGLRTERTPA